nr:hypothetical protein [Actinoplanes atraurantiacus]
MAGGDAVGDPQTDCRARRTVPMSHHDQSGAACLDQQVRDGRADGQATGHRDGGRIGVHPADQPFEQVGAVIAGGLVDAAGVLHVQDPQSPAAQLGLDGGVVEGGVARRGLVHPDQHQARLRGGGDRNAGSRRAVADHAQVPLDGLAVSRGMSGAGFPLRP